MAIDPAKLFSKIKELGHTNNKRDELLEYCKLKVEQIIKYIPRRILNSDGGDILDCILNGLPDQSTPTKYKVKVIDIVLHVMKSEPTSLTHCGDVISRLCLELPRLPIVDLMRWSNDCVQSIVDDSDVNMVWKDVIPECLSAISSHGQVKHCGTDMSPVEYKEQCVRTLCQCRWTERQLVQLAAMFQDLHLNRSDHRQVVKKLCSYVIDVPPETLPALFHQLLKLCKAYDMELVLAYMSHYFNVRLYSKLEPPPQDSESTTMDIDDIVPYSSAELSRCLSTCVYHVSQGTADPELVRKHLKLWPRTQLLRNTFLLDVTLALSDKGADFRVICLDVIKLAIEQKLQDEQKSKQSAWVRSVIAPDVDIAGVLKVLTTESARNQLTTVGLINLALGLLSRHKASPAHCSFAELILVRLAKSQPETAPHILGKLADRLVGDLTAQKQYANCLYVLCKLTPVSMERCTQLCTILESCQPSGSDFRAAAAVLDAVHPLLNFSTRVRDTLVMVCRKGLYSRDSLHRCLALSGSLTLLRHTRLPRDCHSSLSEQLSTYSYLTQLTVDLHATKDGAAVTSRVRNEAVCMEVASILRRCLLQDAAVKQLLFSEIYECVKDKQVLHECILEMLYEHLTKYVDEENDCLQFDKCVQVNTITSVLLEPLAYLLYVVAQFLQPVEDDDLEDILGSQSVETGSAYLRSKLQMVLNKLCENNSLATVDMDCPGLTDLTPESKAKCLKVQQILQCYEALMAHQLMQWTTTSHAAADNVYKLFKSYTELIDKTKTIPKVGKKGSKSTLNDTKETVKSQKSQQSQKDKGKGLTKLSNLVKDRAGPFKALPCLWDLHLCARVLELLYGEEVPWSSLEQRNQIRTKRDFHHHVLRCVTSVLSSDHLDKKQVATHVVKIASILYKRCFCRFQDMCDFDEQTAIECVDLLSNCLTVLLSPTFGFKVDAILPKITDAEDINSSVVSILEQIHSILELMLGEGEADVQSKHIVTSLSAVASTVLAVASPGDAITAAIMKLEDFVRKCAHDCIVLIPFLLTANCREHQDAQFLDQLLTKLTSTLGKIDEEETSAGQETEHFPSIDEKNGHTVLSHVCTHLLARFKHIEHLLSRAKDLQQALQYSTENNSTRIDKELKETDSALVTALCQASWWAGRVGRLRCAVGGGSERVLAVCVRLYPLLSALVRRGAVLPPARLERLLKLCGKKLSTVTDNLITYLEASQPQQASAHKVLRDTKQIPRLVLEAEQFTKHVLLLQNKVKVNFSQYLSLGTARDFRIKAPILEQVLNARDPPDETKDDDETNINDAETTVLSPAASDDEEATAKRRRLS